LLVRFAGEACCQWSKCRRVASAGRAPLSTSPGSPPPSACISGPDGEIGASKLTGEVLDIMARVPETIKRMTGVDLGEVRGWCRG
jgi:flotillin